MRKLILTIWLSLALSIGVAGQASALINPFAINCVGDADASAFVAAAGVTGSQACAVNQLTLDLKAGGVWTKMLAIYPFVGGTATAHKWNLKDPQDTNGAYRISGAGWTSLTHDANGVTGNGTNVGSTNFQPNVNYANESMSVGVFVKTASTNTTPTYYIGCNDGSRWYFFSRNNSGNVGGMMDGNNVVVASTQTGFFVVNHLPTTISGNTELYRNGTSIGTAAFSGSGLVTSPVSISGVNFSASSSNGTLSFAFIGTGMTSGEITAFYTAVNSFRTALGR